MDYGICPQSVVALREIPDETATMVSQMLYGEAFKIIETRKHWSKVRLAHDKFEGWSQNLQIQQISEEDYQNLTQEESHRSLDLISHVESAKGIIKPILLGTVTSSSSFLKDVFEEAACHGAQKRESLLDTALLYLKTPYLNGGRTPFGIDASGFTQMVYLINGYYLAREAEQQSKQGQALSFIEESEPGDLAFFDDSEGVIDHVGIILQDNHVIHCHGEVRIDRIDHTGIFNRDTRRYSHQLRVIKKVI